jgi:3-deoxy-D-manno-octulosonic-acid transferase
MSGTDIWPRAVPARRLSPWLAAALHDTPLIYSLYSFLFSLWIAAMTPYFLMRAKRHKKYLPNLRQRLGHLPASLRSDGRPTIWIHSCSVGETLSVQPLAQALHDRFPQVRFVFSTITEGGQAIAVDRFAKYGAGNSFYFPIDLSGIARRVLDCIQPTMLITIDTEIWPNTLHEAALRNVPIVMVNGRISAKSFSSYRWVQALLGEVFRNYTLFLMKSPEDAHRIQRLGAPPSKIQVSGNIKYDRDLIEKEVTEAQSRSLDESFGLTGADAPLIVAGSTHEDEEATLLDVLRRVRQSPGLAGTRLLITPRHKERFDHVADVAARAGFSIARRSSGTPVPDADVLILDTFGELATAYGFATVVFVGGTLIPHGGQSIMEPAVYGKAIVIGPHMENFPGIIDDFLAVGGVSQIPADETDKEAQKQQLTEHFVRLLSDESARAALGKAAHSVFEKSKGATKFTVDRIAAILEKELAK